MMSAHFRLEADISPLFPYLNSVAPAAAFFEKPKFIRFILDGILCGLYPRHGVAAPFAGREEALDFLELLLHFLNDIHRRRDDVVPNHKRWKPVPVLDIFRLLPRSNCRECGFATCLAFAAALSQHQTSPERCPALPHPISEQAIYPVLDDQGNVLSTVTIDLDTGRSGRNLASQQQYHHRLEGKVSHRIKNPDTAQGNENTPLPKLLTDREIEVLRLLAQGDTNVAISHRLSISPHTVKSHVIHIFNKLGVNDRTQAAVWAARHQLV